MPATANAPHDSGHRVLTRKVPFYSLKYLLTRVGARMSKQMVHNLSAATNYLETGRWVREHCMEPRHRWETREQLFDALGQLIAHQPVLYLEFGVYRGDSLRYWSRLLRNPSSHLHGFDSFEGLPEGFTLLFPKGHLSTAGQMPQIGDPRVKLFKGWFQDTLPHYVAPPHEVLVINIDCDLHSSATYVLNSLLPLMAPGTYLYFDEFADEDHELRAFEEFIEKNKHIRLEVIGATGPLSQMLFQITGKEARP
jgi:Macrocin-O-methyltransferase (TylF)